MQSRPASRTPDAGVTLVEMLVVLAIIGVAAGAIGLSVAPGDRAGRAEAEAVRLAASLRVAVDGALLSGQPAALIWTDQGYRFQLWSLSGQTWRDGESIRAFAPPLAMTRRDGAPAAPVLIDPAGTGGLVEFALHGKGAPWLVRFDGFSAVAVPEDGS